MPCWYWTMSTSCLILTNYTIPWALFEFKFSFAIVKLLIYFIYMQVQLMLILSSFSCIKSSCSPFSAMSFCFCCNHRHYLSFALLPLQAMPTLLSCLFTILKQKVIWKEVKVLPKRSWHTLWKSLMSSNLSLR